ncbi:MAG TPA: chemotaxis protein CheW [Methanoregulaceae archaeon]|nr:chemotaxis protein CheW [Methanoregulaceae archaeon]HPD75865.1 chemotaxis protein CheW [Methanoregulaceae archaeon]HRY75885.1 chemotaxis protein CheW [Methanoregulaceae archaeon]
MTSLLTFSVDGIPCAIPNEYSLFVVQMIALKQPAVPGGMTAGMVNIEGTILPVYSLRRLFGFDDRPPRTSDILIIAHSGTETVALWADETSGVADIPPVDNTNSPLAPAGLRITSDGVVIIQDLPALLAGADPVAVHAILPPATRDTGTETEDFSHVQDVLKKRAQRIARPVRAKKEEMPVEVLKFRLANQEYALTMDHIREVDLTGEITPVPGTPDYISGICAIRGEIISLVDLREFFRIRNKGLTDLNRVIVITDGTITFGILADFITGIGMLPREMLAPVRPGQTTIADKYLLGAVRDLIVLDAAAFLADPQMVINDTRM